MLTGELKDQQHDSQQKSSPNKKREASPKYSFSKNTKRPIFYSHTF
jgi:hypothetical protein